MMIEESKIAKEIRYRSASNMQNVWDQLMFGETMDKDIDCSDEADAFLGVLSDLVWKYVEYGSVLNADDVEHIVLNHSMAATAQKVAGYRGQEVKSGLISQAIVKILDSCHLLSEKDYGEDRLYVEDIVGWWFGKLGTLCSSDERFCSEDFLDWTIEGTSLYFLLNYQVNKELLKKYVAGWEIKPEEILSMSVEYRREDQVESYRIHYKETSDQDLASSAHIILHNEACMVYHDKLWRVTKMLTDAQLFEELTDLFVKVDFPVLQASMLSEITELDDLLSFSEKLSTKIINYPLTSFSLIREYLFELCARISANLLSYQKDNYGRKLTNGLEEQWKVVNDAWWNNLPGYFSRGLSMLKAKLDSKGIAGWAFAKKENLTQRQTAASEGYNRCIKVLKEEVLKVYQPQELPVTSGDLQYLLYIGSVYLTADEKPSPERFSDLLDKITETIKVNKILPVSSIDNKLIEDGDIAARILCECYPDKEGVFSWFDRYKTWYEGWGVLPADKLYDNCHKECHLLCWLIMVASLDSFSENELEGYWTKLMTTLFCQLSAASGYFKSEYTNVLILAGMVAVQIYNKGLKSFLENSCRHVINIDDLILIVNNSNVTRLLTEKEDLREELKDTVYTIAERFKAEWPLKSKRLEMGGYHAKERVKAIENVVQDWKTCC